ncbi:DUF6483 family protein [Clostridium kluyveri]|uniref:RNA polymerase alpha subunit C-terminal domain-containing protein n=1 Tax=Clostridium kluyveri TaxID=1534 RepID=A0A1L5F454_CLOKL|nr:DUF6483 family protein [Clostridium kluyveri]APM37789.1 hypothetical protein BS101_03030 [Clostridium kluyveri]
MTKIHTRNLEIMRKIKEGVGLEELAKEYKISFSTITSTIERYKEFESYSNEMENLKAKNRINQETELYDLCKLLKFHTHSIKALVHKNIRSIDKLLSLNEEEFYLIKNLGEVSQKYIKECISEYKEKMKQHPNTNDNANKNEVIEEVNIEGSELQRSINEQVRGMKVNREYIYKLIEDVHNGKNNLEFLQKEISKEFERIENVNKELLQTLINLYMARVMPWADNARRYKVDMECELQWILDKYNNNDDGTISQDGLLEIMVKRDIHDHKLREAESKLIGAIHSRKSKRSYEIALFFYNDIDKWDEDKLAKCNFSKQKIKEGLKFVKELYEQG